MKNYDDNMKNLEYIFLNILLEDQLFDFYLF